MFPVKEQHSLNYKFPECRSSGLCLGSVIFNALSFTVPVIMMITQCPTAKQHMSQWDCLETHSWEIVMDAWWLLYTFQWEIKMNCRCFPHSDGLTIGKSNVLDSSHYWTKENIKIVADKLLRHGTSKKGLLTKRRTSYSVRTTVSSKSQKLFLGLELQLEVGRRFQRTDTGPGVICANSCCIVIHHLQNQISQLQRTLSSPLAKEAFNFIWVILGMGE